VDFAFEIDPVQKSAEIGKKKSRTSSRGEDCWHIANTI
jgi:hypothetical protein